MDYRNCTILYVDDEEKSLKYFAKAFSTEFRVLTAANAAQAYKLLKEHRDEITLLFSDQRLPGEKGVEFLEQARKLQPAAIRILTTAYSDFDVAIEAVNSAAIFKYVTKPWDITELERILKRACDVHREQSAQDLLPSSRSSEREMMTPHAASDPGELKTLDQVAQYLNVNKFTVYRLVIQKKIPAFKVGSQWRFKQDLLDNWLMSKSNIRKKT
jgi:excisionase family DNA binding protein